MLNLKEIRENNNYLQKDIAKITNHTVSCISSWEKGITQPDIADLKKMADFFGCTIDYLVGRENEDGTVVFMGNQTSKDENRLLDITRTLNPVHKEMLYRFAGYLKAEEKKQKK